MATYRESGKVPPAAVALGLGLGIPLAVGLGGLYSVLTHYITIFPLDVMLGAMAYAGFGAGLGKLAYRGQVRSRRAFYALLVLAVLAAQYGLLVIFLYFCTDNQLLVSAPDAIAFLLARVAEVREVTVGSLRRGGTGGPGVSGLGLWIGWTAEFCLLSAALFWTAQENFPNIPFCEPCGQWVEEGTSLITQPVSQQQADALRRDLEAGRYEPYTEFSFPDEDSTVLSQVLFRRCPGCTKTPTSLTVTRLTPVVDDKGNTSIKVETLLENLLISDDYYSQVLAWLSSLDTEAKAEAEETPEGPPPPEDEAEGGAR